MPDTAQAPALSPDSGAPPESGRTVSASAAPLSTTPPAGTAAAAPPKKRKRRPNVRRTRNILLALVLLALLGAGGFFLHRFLTQEEPQTNEISAQPVSYGIIQSRASGWGSTKVKDSASVVMTASGTVVDVYVSVGDTVTAGQPLYEIFSQEVQDRIDAAQDAVTAQQEVIRERESGIGKIQDDIADRENSIAELEEDVAAIEARKADLTVRAPFTGKLLLGENGAPALEDSLDKGAAVATLVDDSRLKLNLYFSYAYKDDIVPGKEATVTIPAVMGTFPGTVEEVHDISYISPEGAVHFEAVVVFDNPGTLSEKMNASASLTAADGTEIFPYASGSTEFYERRTVKTKESGPVQQLGNLYNYANIREGDMLAVLGPDNLDKEIEEVRKQEDSLRKEIEGLQDQIEDVRDQIAEENRRLAELQQAVEEQKKDLDSFSGSAPMDGTVTTCTLIPGEDVKSGDTVITIQDQSSMAVEISVDDRNIVFIQPGMEVELEASSGGMYIGTVESVNMEGMQTENGMTTYPVTLSVDNSDGSLMAGLGMNYSFVTSESPECMMVPLQSVKYVSDENGDTYSVVFIQADQPPENVAEIELPELMEGETPQYPTPEEGFYPVPVETGSHQDTYNIEITSGLNGDETVFVQYLVSSFYS